MSQTSLTSVIRYVKAFNSAATDGSGKTALSFSDIIAAYLTQGSPQIALTTEDIAVLGTYQTPTDEAHIRIKKVSDSDPWKGWLEIHFHDAQVGYSGSKLWLALSASGANIPPLEIDLFEHQPVYLQDGSIKDSTFTIPTLTSPAVGVVGMMVQLWRRFFKKTSLDSNAGQIYTYADDGTTVITTQDASTTAGVQTQGPAA